MEIWFSLYLSLENWAIFFRQNSLFGWISLLRESFGKRKNWDEICTHGGDGDKHMGTIMNYEIGEDGSVWS